MATKDPARHAPSANVADALQLLAKMGEAHPGLKGACRALGVDLQTLLVEASGQQAEPDITQRLSGAEVQQPPIKEPHSLSRKEPWCFYLTVITNNEILTTYDESLLDELIQQPPPTLTLCDTQNTGFAAIDNPCDGNPTPEAVFDVVNLVKRIQQFQECIRAGKLTDSHTLVRHLAKGQLPKEVPKKQRSGQCTKLLVLMDLSKENVHHNLDFVQWQQSLAKSCEQWLQPQFIHILNWQPLRWRYSQLHREAYASELPKPCYDPLPTTDGQTLVLLFINPKNMETPGFARWWAQSHPYCGGSLHLSLQPHPGALCPETARPWEVSQIAAQKEQVVTHEKAILSCLSTTSGRLTLSMVRRLRKEVFKVPIAVETMIFNHPDIIWERDNGCGYWERPEQQRLQDFAELPLAQQRQAADIIQACLPQQLDSLRFENALLLNQLAPKWGEQNKPLLTEATQWFKSITGEVLRKLEQPQKNEAYINFLYHLERRLSENTAALPDTIRQAIVVNNHQLQRLCLDIAVGQTVESNLQQALSHSDAKYQQVNGVLLQQGQQWQMVAESDPATQSGVTLANIEDIYTTSLHYKDIVKPLRQQIKMPQGKSVLTLKNSLQHLNLRILSSQDFYWAESVTMDNSGVTAITAEGIHVYWPNTPECDGCPEINLPDSAPEFLERYHPVLDEHGLFIEVIIGSKSFKLRYIPPGSFLMGSPETEEGRREDEQQRIETLNQGFWLADTTVTIGVWELFVSEHRHYFTNRRELFLPKVGIDLRDAYSFCRKLSRFCGLGLTIPSSVQWEYACRAGTQSAFSFGEKLNDEDANFNYKKNGPLDNKGFKPNNWGLYQMHGNLWEWCGDGLEEFESYSINERFGDLHYKSAVLRGGCWKDSARYCRSAYRNFKASFNTSYYRSFRVSLRLPKVTHKTNQHGKVKVVGKQSPRISQNSLCQTELTQNPLDLAAISTRARWQLRPPEDPFPAPWASSWGFDQYGLWQSFTIAGISQKLRYIPPGQFLMGSPEAEKYRSDNETQHQVTITQGFWLGETTVTQALWQAVMGENPSCLNEKEVGQDTSGFPVEQISWDDAADFCQKINQMLGLSLTLPSEAQWEYACRANTQTPFNTGGQLYFSDANFGWVEKHQGNLSDTDKALIAGRTCYVDAYVPNGWGLYQMHGNVWEWCRDNQREYAQEAMENPLGDTDTRDAALRGGSWASKGQHCRSASRGRYERDNRDNSIGLRVSQGTGQELIAPQASPLAMHVS